MYLSDYETYLSGLAKHQDIIADSDTYRQMGLANAPSSSARMLERIGTGLISIGRRLCERRGRLAVEIVFRHTVSEPQTRGHVA